jgi:ferritin
MLIGDKMEDDRERLKKILEHNFLARKVEVELGEILRSRDYFKKALENFKEKGEIPSIRGVIEEAFNFGKADGATTKLLKYLMDQGLVSAENIYEIVDYLEDIGTDTYYTMSSLGMAIDEMVKSKKKEIVG